MEADAESIELQLATYLERRSHQPLAHPLPEICHLIAIVGVAQTEHRPCVNDRLKLIVEVTAYPLRRTVRIEQFRMLGFEVLQFMHQEVELLVGNDRSILHIIAVVMLVQFIA